MVNVVVAVDRVLVDPEHERGADERASDLRRPVTGHLLPREAPPQGAGQRDRRIDMRPADPARNVDRERDCESPSPGDEQPVATRIEDRGPASRLVQGGDGHRDHPVAEADQDERADALAGELARGGPPPARRCPPGRGRGRHARNGGTPRAHHQEAWSGS